MMKPPVNVWTVNEEYEMLRMIDYGVDGIITDYPLKLKKLCEKENISGSNFSKNSKRRSRTLSSEAK